MKKIGVLTFHWAANYGAVLQAYALLKHLNDKGYDAEDVDYRPSTVIRKLKFFDLYLKRFSNIKRRLKIKTFPPKYLKLSKNKYRCFADLRKTNGTYDALICGSDQIWNPDLVPTDSMYWLPFVEKGKNKIAYAPSFGASTVTEKQKEQIKANLSTFKAVSCRENSGARTINQIIGEKKCEAVLDPTMLIERDYWDTISEDKIYDEKYIFAYMLRGTAAQRKYIEKIARERNLKIVSIPFLDYEKIDPYDLKFGDYKLWDANPAEFISAIRHAEYVFCDSFHCIVFSILYHRPFFVFPKVGADGKVKKSQISRMTDLLELAEIKNRILLDNEEADLDAEIDWNNSDKRIQKARCDSERYLEQALFM